jgi:hypothetical protein
MAPTGAINMSEAAAIFGQACCHADSSATRCAPVSKITSIDKAAITENIGTGLIHGDTSTEVDDLLKLASESASILKIPAITNTASTWMIKTKT